MMWPHDYTFRSSLSSVPVYDGGAVAAYRCRFVGTPGAWAPDGRPGFRRAVLSAKTNDAGNVEIEFEDREILVTLVPAEG